MAEFEVFSISSEQDADGGVLIVFAGELYGASATYQLKIEGSKVDQTTVTRVLPLNADRLPARTSMIERHSDIEVGSDRMTAKWRVVTDQGHDITFRLTLPLLEEFAKYLEDAMVHPASH